MTSLERLLKLAKKTKTTVVIYDPTGGEEMVILPLSEYEALLEGQNDGQKVSPHPHSKVIARQPVPDFPPPPPMPPVRDLEKESKERVEEEIVPLPPDPIWSEQIPTPPEPEIPLVAPRTRQLPSESSMPQGWFQAGSVIKNRFTSGEWLRPKEDMTIEEREKRAQMTLRKEDEDDPVFYDEPAV